MLGKNLSDFSLKISCFNGVAFDQAKLMILNNFFKEMETAKSIGKISRVVQERDEKGMQY